MFLQNISTGCCKLTRELINLNTVSKLHLRLLAFSHLRRFLFYSLWPPLRAPVRHSMLLPDTPFIHIYFYKKDKGKAAHN